MFSKKEKKNNQKTGNVNVPTQNGEEAAVTNQKQVDASAA